MTVADVTPIQDHTGNNSTTSFAFNFRADNVSWVDVSFTDNLSGISLNADQDSSPGGTVEYTVAPPTDQAIRISRVTPLSQGLDYTRYGPFDSESHEDALDKITMMIQDLLVRGAKWEFVDVAASRTLLISDKFKMLRTTGAGAIQITVPAMADVPFEVGDTISFYKKGSGALTFVGDVGVTVNVATVLTAGPQYSLLTLIMDDNDEWVLGGGLAP